MQKFKELFCFHEFVKDKGEAKVIENLLLCWLCFVEDFKNHSFELLCSKLQFEIVSAILCVWNSRNHFSQ